MSCLSCPLSLAVSFALTFPSVWQLVNWPLAPTEKSLLFLSPQQPKPSYQPGRNPHCPHTPPWESIPDQLEIKYIQKRVLSYTFNGMQLYELPLPEIPGNGSTWLVSIRNALTALQLFNVLAFKKTMDVLTDLGPPSTQGRAQGLP